MNRRTILIATGIACIAALGWGVQQDAVRIPGVDRPLKSVKLGPDVEVDAGGAACSFSGYVWACESCAVPPVRIPKPKYDGDATSVEIIAPENSTIDTSTSPTELIVNLSPVTPELPGCIDAPHQVEIRAMDDANILVSDVLEITVRCCGV